MHYMDQRGRQSDIVMGPAQVQRCPLFCKIENELSELIGPYMMK